MEYTKLKNINNYKSESINPAKMPDTVFEMYSVPIYDTGHPEYLRGYEIASSKAVVKKNDILLCKINPRINRVWVVGDESDHPNIASSEWIVIRTEAYNPDYLAWYFRSQRFQKLMTSEVTGIGGSLTRAQPKRVAEYPVPILDRESQDAVVEVLNKCQLVIDSRREELVKLDNLIKARFVEMFGDYHTNSKGFECHTGSELFKFSSGKFLPENRRLDEGVPVYGGNGIAWYTDEALIDYPTVIIGRVGAWCGNVHTVLEPVWITDNAIYIKEQKTDKFMLEFLTELMKVMDFHQYADFSGQPKITQKPLETLNYITPPLEMQNEFTEFVKQVDKSKSAVQKSLDEAQLLFDSLMQEYFG